MTRQVPPWRSIWAGPYYWLFKKKKGIRTGSSLSSALAKKEITHKVGNRKILSKRLIFNRSATCQKSEIRNSTPLPPPLPSLWRKKLGQISLLIWVMSQTSGQNTVKEGGNMTDIPWNNNHREMRVNAFLVLRTGTKKSPSTHKLFIGCELPVERLTIRQHLVIITGKKAG